MRKAQSAEQSRANNKPELSQSSARAQPARVALDSKRNTNGKRRLRPTATYIAAVLPPPTKLIGISPHDAMKQKQQSCLNILCCRKTQNSILLIQLVRIPISWRANIRHIDFQTTIDLEWIALQFNHCLRGLLTIGNGITCCGQLLIAVSTDLN